MWNCGVRAVFARVPLAALLRCVVLQLNVTHECNPTGRRAGDAQRPKLVGQNLPLSAVCCGVGVPTAISLHPLVMEPFLQITSCRVLFSSNTSRNADEYIAGFSFEFNLAL